MPKVFWAEDVSTSVYLLNRLPLKAQNKQTPYQVWYNQKPSLTHLRIFGSLCYVSSIEHDRDKFDPRADESIFIGYCTNQRGYRVYKPATREVIATRNVNFLENGKWNWSENRGVIEQQEELHLQHQVEESSEHNAENSDAESEEAVRGT